MPPPFYCLSDGAAGIEVKARQWSSATNVGELLAARRYQICLCFTPNDRWVKRIRALYTA